MIDGQEYRIPQSLRSKCYTYIYMRVLSNLAC
jgi:hypothetical protein